ncbi:hypothetical protein BS78_08G100400 [Paspalum vaginatum]|nr:hypothetical protein BS78_08G100400 [Paspalum vaginatum]
MSDSAKLDDITKSLAAITQQLARLPVIEQQQHEQSAAIAELQEQNRGVLVQHQDGGRGRPGGYGHHEDRPPRFHKMDFPHFDGKTDPLLFINKCESFFHKQRTLEEEKVWMASFNLEGAAQQWYMHLHSIEGTPSWRHFS